MAMAVRLVAKPSGVCLSACGCHGPLIRLRLHSTPTRPGSGPVSSGTLKSSQSGAGGDQASAETRG